MSMPILNFLVFGYQVMSQYGTEGQTEAWMGKMHNAAFRMVTQ